MKAALILFAMILAGCTTTPAPISDPRAVWCEQNQPLKLPALAVALLSRAEKEALAAYQIKGENWCSWS